MKRTVLLLNALLLVGAFTGCSTNTTNLSSEYIPDVTAPATEPPVATTENTPTMIDVFEDIGFNINPTTGYYPFRLDISVNPSNPAIGYNDYIVEIISADTQKVKISVAIDTEEIADYLEENYYVLASTSKDYEIPVKDMFHSLVSLDCLNEDNFKTINETAKERSDGQDLTLVSVYANLPTDGVDYVSLAKDENRHHGNRFEYTAVSPDPYGLYLIYKNTASYYAVYCTPVFQEDGTLILTGLDTSHFINLKQDVGALSSSTAFGDEASVFASVEAHSQDFRENHVPDIQLVKVEGFTPTQEEETIDIESEQPTT